MTEDLVIATRGSKLALWQSEHVRSLFKKAGIKSKLNVIKTQGDRIQDRFLHEIGGKGLFVRELEESILASESHLAVHSLKDLPAILPRGFKLVSILPRHSSVDALVFRKGFWSKTNLSCGGTVGAEDVAKLGPIKIATSSLRRTRLLVKSCPDLEILPIRGNVDTRLEKLESQGLDALVLAHASLERLGLTDLPHVTLDKRWFVPCAAQGALAIESKDTFHREEVEKLDCRQTRAAVVVERRILADLGGDCTMPCGVHCFAYEEGRFRVDATVLSPKGEARASMDFAKDTVEKEPADVSRHILEQLKARGVIEILRDLKIEPPDSLVGGV